MSLTDALHEDFLDACLYGDIKKVKKIISIVDIDFQNESGATALMNASTQGHTDIAELLINEGACLDIQNNSGGTALIRASRYGHIDIVKMLLERGAKLDFQCKSGSTALIAASYKNHINVCSVLMKYGANIDIKDKLKRTSYIIADDQNHIPLMFLLNPSMIEYSDEQGYTFLMRACEKLNEEHILFLYEKGADFFIENRNGDSALDILMKHNKLSDKFKTLIEKIILEQSINYSNDTIMGL